MNQSIFQEIEAVMPALVETGLMRSLVTLQQPDGNSTADGSPSGVFVDVAGLTNIVCMNAPEPQGTPSASENKSVDQVESSAERHVLLDKYYAAVPEGNGDGWRAVLDGVVYDFLGGDADSQRSQTRLKLRIVKL